MAVISTTSVASFYYSTPFFATAWLGCSWIEVLYEHVVVFGGTNVGKSTIINILAESGVASVSPEGAHTRHAHVFATEHNSPIGENPYAFKSFVCSGYDSQTESDAAVYFKSYLVPGTIPENVALWDTPDCDAVGSSRYLASVVEAVSAADIVIYVTTVEKYTVQHIVEWLFNLHDAGIWIIEGINKTPKRDREAVIRKQQSDVFPKMAEQLGLPPPAPGIIALGNMTEGEEGDLWGPEHVEVETSPSCGFLLADRMPKWQQPVAERWHSSCGDLIRGWSLSGWRLKRGNSGRRQ